MKIISTIFLVLGGLELFVAIFIMAGWMNDNNNDIKYCWLFAVIFIVVGLVIIVISKIIKLWKKIKEKIDAMLIEIRVL